MIIDLVNYTLYDPGAEATILFRLHESGLRVPRFFCITEAYVQEEMETYFATHFQDILQFSVRLTASVQIEKTTALLSTSISLPFFMHVKKYALHRHIKQFLQECERYRKKIADADAVPQHKIVFHILVQEEISIEQLGMIKNDTANGVLNQTDIMLNIDWEHVVSASSCRKMQLCYHDSDQILYYHMSKGTEPLDMTMLCALEQAVQIIKSQYGSDLQILFCIEKESHHLYALSAKRAPCFLEETCIYFDSRSILSSFYPATQTPLMASCIKYVYSRLIHNFFKDSMRSFQRSHDITEIVSDDMVAYIDGRIYFCMKHWNFLFDYVPTFRKKNILKETSMRTKKKYTVSDWFLYQYVLSMQRQFARMNFKKAYKVIDLVKEEIQMFHVEMLHTVNREELRNYFLQFMNHVELYWKHALLCSLCSRISIQKLKKIFKRYKRDDIMHLKYQYITGALPIPSNLNRKLKKQLECAREEEQIRCCFFKLQNQQLTLFEALFHEIGERLVKKELFVTPDEIQFITLNELDAFLKKGIILWNRAEIQERKAIYDWNCHLPNRTGIVLHGSAEKQQKQLITHAIFPSGNGKTHGRPCVPGLASCCILICHEGEVPKREEVKDKILVTQSFCAALMTLPLQGLILEEDMLITNLFSDAQQTIPFPVISGVTSACSLMQYTEIVSMNGWTGEIAATAKQMEKTMQNKWACYRREEEI